jgi:hypothetical protein
MSSMIETLPFSDAKARLSALMTSVVHDYQPKAVHRHHGKEEMFLVPQEVMRAMVENVAFDPQVSIVPGEFVVRLPELNLIGGGETFDAALDDLVDVASAFAEQYFGRLRFFAESERLARLPWVAKIAFTPADARRGLFEGRSERQGPLVAS